MADTKISDETAAGTLDGTEIVPVVKSAANRRSTTGAIAGLSVGLFSRIMSAPPSAANTGLSSWLNQGGASVADGPQGIILTVPASSSLSLRSRSMAAPGATPYSFTALVGIDSSHADFSGVYIGWHDGTKLQVMILRHANGINQLEVDNLTDSTTYSATPASTTNIESNPLWMKIADDGTNVSFAYSFTGDSFKTLYSVAKASGFLGASGYSNIVFGGHDQANLGFGCSLLSWTQGT